MKYLISILILFSSLSYSSIYFICEEPHIFYPELKERLLIEIYPPKHMYSEGAARMRYLSDDAIILSEKVYDDLTSNDREYSWLNSRYKLNRTTGLLNNNRECQTVKKLQYLKALQELIDINKKVLDKRKF